MAVFIFKQ